MKFNKIKEPRNNILKIGSKNLSKENWKVFSPDGKHMFTCGEDKAKWYIDRDLAEKINDFEIKFTFDPKGYGYEDDEEFGKTPRENICVVSGLKTGLQRHHIVPYCYRKYFPEKYKSKNHHDIVLINFKYHSEYEQYAKKFKNDIGKMYGVKTINQLNIEYITKVHEIGKEYSIICNDLNSIFKAYGNLSNDAILTKLESVSNLTNIPLESLRKFNYIQLYKIYDYLNNKRIEDIKAFKQENRKKYDHGYLIAQKLDSEEKMKEFIKLWRVHFINTMNPKYMPYGWNVDFRIKTNL